MSATATEDFDTFVNQEWKDRNPIPDDQVRWGPFLELHEDNLRRLRKICEEDAGLVGQLYKKASTVPDQISPKISELLNRINTIDGSDSFWTVTGELFRSGISVFFHICKGSDDKNPDWYIPHLVQSGLGLPDKSYYTERTDLHQPYKTYITNLFQAYGLHEPDTDEIFEFEAKHADLHLTRVQLRDVDKTYNKFNEKDIQLQLPAQYYDVVFKDVAISDMLVQNTELLEEFEDIVDNTEVSVLKDYLTFKVLNGMASYQTQPIIDLKFEFYGKTLNGQKQLDDLWKRAVSKVEGFIGDEVGKLYVSEHFPLEKQQQCHEMIQLLIQSLRQTLHNLDWMTPETKKAALRKLDTFNPKVGVPSKYHSIEGLWPDGIAGYDLTELAVQWSQWDWQVEECQKFYTKVDKDLWHMTPQTVNAYYNATQNEIVFPAGILQKPFFGHDTMTENLGAIGVVIGHEMSHGFDDQGRKYNEKGELKEWWTEQDCKEFDKRATVVKDHFNTFSYFGGSVNGELTLGENIADIGGLKLALNALKLSQQDPISTEQYDLFFRAYASIWRFNVREESALKLLKIDPHSPARFRINGALPHIDEFYSTYGVQEGDGMYLTPDKRMNIW